MKKLLGIIGMAVAIFAGVRHFRRSGIQLTDSREQNVALLQKIVAAANESLPKRLDSQTVALRIDVTNSGIVNRYRITSRTAMQISVAGLMRELLPALRRQACSNRLYKMTMAKGFSVSYAYVDREDVPAGTITIRRADCLIP